MPNFILTRSSVIVCPHGAPVMHAPVTSSHSTVNGELVLFPNDNYTVAGCPFSSPCYRIVWTNPSKNFMMQGKPVLTSASIGIAQNFRNAAQGAASILTHQTIATD